jgi:voltage-gated potassium channel
VGRLANYRAHGGYEAWERNADYVLIPLALIFLAVLLIPVAVHLTPAEQAAFLVANIFIWVVFAVDYVARLYLAPERGRFVRTHVLDFIVVAVPFLRPLRLLRVVGIIGEYVVRSRRHLARRALAFASIAAVVAVFAGAAIIFSSERNHPHASLRTFPDALWWSVGTITTVGTNGDPTTGTGRVVATGMMVVGVALVAIFTGAVATYFISVNDERPKVEENIEAGSPSVAQDLATMKASVNGLYAELTSLRAHLSDLIEQMPSASDETGRSDGAGHRVRRGE